MTSGTYIATMLILDRERRKRRGKGQANSQVSFEAAKGALIGYYYRYTYTSGRAGDGGWGRPPVNTLAFIYFLIFHH